MIKKLNQQGAAAMMSVTIFAIIITVVVTAYLRSAISEQAAAQNYDFNTRAFYSAEVGVQDALRTIKTNSTLSQQVCVGSDFASAVGLSYTCQLIDSTPGSVNFEVSEGENAMVRLQPADMSNFPNQFKLVVRWSTKAEAIARGLVARQNNSNTFTTQDNWYNDNGAFHPALRLSVLSHSTNAYGGLDQKVLFLNPVNNNDGDGSSQITLGSEQPEEDVTNSAKCYNATSPDSFGEYLCQHEVTLSNYDLNNRALYARIHSLYAATGVEVFLAPVDNINNPFALTGSAVEIDVTGKAGSTFRRIKQTFSLPGGVIKDNLPDAAIIAGGGICKLYSITDLAVDYTPDSCMN